MPKRCHEGLGPSQLQGGKSGCDGNEENDHERGVAAEHIQHGPQPARLGRMAQDAITPRAPSELHPRHEVDLVIMCFVVELPGIGDAEGYLV